MVNDKQDLVVERIFDAPREAVWRAWTDMEMFKRWWGPEYFTCPRAESDLRPGGRYIWAMRDPEGRDSYSAGVFHEVVPMERLVYTDSFADEHGAPISPALFGLGDDFPAETVVTITFEDLGDGRTLLRAHNQGFPGGEMREMATAGWLSSLDKLAAVIGSK